MPNGPLPAALTESCDLSEIELVTSHVMNTQIRQRPPRQDMLSTHRAREEMEARTKPGTLFLRLLHIQDAGRKYLISTLVVSILVAPTSNYKLSTPDAEDCSWTEGCCQ